MVTFQHLVISNLSRTKVNTSVVRAPLYVKKQLFELERHEIKVCTLRVVIDDLVFLGVVQAKSFKKIKLVFARV